MISDVIDWFKGLFGDTAEQVTDRANDTMDQVGGDAGEALGTLQDTGQDLAGEGYGQAFVEEGLAGAQENVTETAQGFQDQAEMLGGIAEDPWGAAEDEARNRLGGEG